jgi:hypothetical protein
VVEFSRAFGGFGMFALLGAQFTPEEHGNCTVFEVPFGDSLDEFLLIGMANSCVSELGSPLITGLPSEYADPALAGLTGTAKGDPWPAGLVRVDRAGFHKMDSPEMAFRLAGDLLASTLKALLRGEDPAVAAQNSMEKW